MEPPIPPASPGFYENFQEMDHLDCGSIFTEDVGVFMRSTNRNISPLETQTLLKNFRDYKIHCELRKQLLVSNAEDLTPTKTKQKITIPIENNDALSFSLLQELAVYYDKQPYDARYNYCRGNIRSDESSSSSVVIVNTSSSDFEDVDATATSTSRRKKSTATTNSSSSSSSSEFVLLLPYRIFDLSASEGKVVNFRKPDLPLNELEFLLSEIRVDATLEELVNILFAQYQQKQQNSTGIKITTTSFADNEYSLYFGNGKQKSWLFEEVVGNKNKLKFLKVDKDLEYRLVIYSTTDAAAENFGGDTIDVENSFSASPIARRLRNQKQQQHVLSSSSSNQTEQQLQQKQQQQQSNSKKIFGSTTFSGLSPSSSLSLKQKIESGSSSEPRKKHDETLPEKEQVVIQCFDNNNTNRDDIIDNENIVVNDAEEFPDAADQQQSSICSPTELFSNIIAFLLTVLFWFHFAIIIQCVPMKDDVNSLMNLSSSSSLCRNYYFSLENISTSSTQSFSNDSNVSSTTTPTMSPNDNNSLVAVTNWLFYFIFGITFFLMLLEASIFSVIQGYLQHLFVGVSPQEFFTKLYQGRNAEFRPEIQLSIFCFHLLAKQSSATSSRGRNHFHYVRVPTFQKTENIEIFAFDFSSLPPQEFRNNNNNNNNSDKKCCCRVRLDQEILFENSSEILRKVTEWRERNCHDTHYEMFCRIEFPCPKQILLLSSEEDRPLFFSKWWYRVFSCFGLSFFHRMYLFMRIPVVDHSVKVKIGAKFGEHQQKFLNNNRNLKENCRPDHFIEEQQKQKQKQNFDDTELVPIMKKTNNNSNNNNNNHHHHHHQKQQSSKPINIKDLQPGDILQGKVSAAIAATAAPLLSSGNSSLTLDFSLPSSDNTIITPSNNNLSHQESSAVFSVATTSHLPELPPFYEIWSISQLINSFVPIHQLSKMRVVCSAWNDAVCCLPSFAPSIVIIRRSLFFKKQKLKQLISGDKYGISDKYSAQKKQLNNNNNSDKKKKTKKNKKNLFPKLDLDEKSGDGWSRKALFHLAMFTQIFHLPWLFVGIAMREDRSIDWILSFMTIISVNFIIFHGDIFFRKSALKYAKHFLFFNLITSISSPIAIAYAIASRDNQFLIVTVVFALVLCVGILISLSYYLFWKLPQNFEVMLQIHKAQLGNDMSLQHLLVSDYATECINENIARMDDDGFARKKKLVVVDDADL